MPIPNQPLQVSSTPVSGLSSSTPLSVATPAAAPQVAPPTPAAPAPMSSQAPTAPPTSMTNQGYVPLTESQYNAAVQAGYSPSEIIANEQQRKASMTPKPQPQSFGSRLGQAFSQTMSTLPGFLNSPFAAPEQVLGKGLASGIRAVQATPDVLTGNVAGAQATMAKPLFGVPTLGSSSPLQNLGTAAQAASFLPGLGEVSSIVGNQTGRAAIQGAVAGGIGGGGSYLANTKSPTLLGTAGSVAQGAAGGAAAGAVAPSLLEQAQTAHPYREAFSAIGNGIKNTVTNVPGQVQSMIEGPTLTDKLSNLDDQIQTGIDKGVKPSVAATRTQTMRENFNEGSNNAVRNLADLRNDLDITDANGEKIDTANTPPKTVAQMAQATDQAKGLIWEKSQAVMKAAGEAGASFDPTPVVEKLNSMSEDKGNSPGVRQYADSLIPEIEELQGADPKTVATRIAEYNKDAQGFFKGTTTNTEANVKAAALVPMRQAMEDSIEESLNKSGNQDLRDQYGEMKALDKEVQHRATVVGRAAPKSLFGGITDAGAALELARGLITMNPADIAGSLATKAVGEYVKNLNSPDANVGRMFQAAWDAKDAADKAGFPNLRGLTAKGVQAHEPSAYEIGATSFRGTPVSNVEDTLPYYETPRAKGFVNYAQQSAADTGVTATPLKKVAGVWEGNIEPSFQTEVTGTQDKVFQHAANLGSKGNQDAVVLFKPGQDVGSKYVFNNIEDPNQAIKTLNNMGVSGGTVDGKSIIVYDADGSLKNNIAKFGDNLGIKPTQTNGTVKFITKDEYGKYSGNLGSNPSPKVSAKPPVVTRTPAVKSEPWSPGSGTGIGLTTKPTR